MSATRAVDTYQFSQGEPTEGLSAANFLLGFDELLLTSRGGLAKQLIVQLHQQMLEGAGGGLHRLGAVLLPEQGSCFV